MGKLLQVISFIFYCVLLSSTANGMSIMEERYDWLPSESAHKQYPMRLIKGDLILKDGSVLYVPARSVIDNGWGEIGSTHVVGSKYKSLPNRLNLTWFSFAEDKFFTGDFELPYRNILDLFRRGTISPSSGHAITYDRVIIGIGPEGAISVWVDAEGEVVQVATYKGTEITMPWKTVLDNDQISRGKYIEEILKDSLSEEQFRHLKARGVTAGISNFFIKQYRWNLSLSGGYQHKVLVKCLNGEGEFFQPHTDNGRTHRALPKGITIRWGDNAGKRHMAKISLDEAEVSAAFNKLSGGNTEHPIKLHLDIGTGPGVVEASVRDSKFIIKLKNLAITRWKLRDSIVAPDSGK